MITKKLPMATRELAQQIGRWFWFDSSKAMALGYEPRFPLEEGVRDYMQWL